VANVEDRPGIASSKKALQPAAGAREGGGRGRTSPKKKQEIRSRGTSGSDPHSSEEIKGRGGLRLTSNIGKKN